jgi:flagellum-specific peptidoglycan hydrolase FlgJ
MTRKEYIQKFAKTVISSVKGTGLFPSVMMAQAILESSNKYGNAGGSTLAKDYNNHFGIKADRSWKGKKVNIQTREVFKGHEVMIGDYFRVYDNPERSFSDRNEFLVKNSNYARAGVFLALTPEAQAEALQRAGYATDPKYANMIKALISMYNLKELDEMARKNDSSSEAA